MPWHFMTICLDGVPCPSTTLGNGRLIHLIKSYPLRLKHVHVLLLLLQFFLFHCKLWYRCRKTSWKKCLIICHYKKNTLGKNHPDWEIELCRPPQKSFTYPIPIITSFLSFKLTPSWVFVIHLAFLYYFFTQGYFLKHFSSFCKFSFNLHIISP